MTKATFAELVAKTYLFDVETPDGETLTLEMRAPSQAEVWALELGMPPKPTPPVSDFEGTFAEGNWKPIFNDKDAGYLRAMQDWARGLQMRRILLCWTEEVPGDTIEEKIKSMDQLPNWTISGLSKCATLVTLAGQVEVSGRPFRSD